MTILSRLLDIYNAILAIAAKDFSVTVNPSPGGCGCGGGITGTELPQPPADEGNLLPDKKCNVAAAIVDYWFRLLDDWSNRNYDDYANVSLTLVAEVISGAGLVAALAAGFAVPLGVIVGVGIILAVAVLLVTETAYNLADMANTILGDNAELIQILYCSSAPDEARDAILAHLLSEGFTAVEMQIMGLVIQMSDMNLLFTPDEATADIPEYTAGCAGCGGSSQFNGMWWNLSSSGFVGSTKLGGVDVTNGQDVVAGTSYKIATAPHEGKHRYQFSIWANAVTPQYLITVQGNDDIIAANIEATLLIGNPSQNHPWDLIEDEYMEVVSPANRGDRRRITIVSDTPFENADLAFQ